MLKLANIVLVLAATSTALMAGLFYAWSCSVTIGLAKVPDTVYITSMQAMNRAIQNAAFFACFFGALLLLPLSAYLHYSSPVPGRCWCLVAASLLYAIGVFGVTVAGNVPLNEALDAFHLPSASAQEIAAQRARFEGSWNRLNLVRAIAGTLSVIMVIIACLLPEDGA